jgi:hypothetical protein
MINYKYVHIFAGEISGLRTGGETILHSYLKHSEARGSKGLLLLREVVAVKPAASMAGCYAYTTRDIHFIELFDKFRTESVGHRPVREMAFTVKPDGTIRPCTDVCYWGRPDFNSSGIVVASGLTYICASYQYTLPGSFDFNYNANKKAAITRSMNLGTGIDCLDCYAYLGVNKHKYK